MTWLSGRVIEKEQVEKGLVACGEPGREPRDQAAGSTIEE